VVAQACRWDERVPPDVLAVTGPRSPPLLAKIPSTADGGRARRLLATTSCSTPATARSSAVSWIGVAGTPSGGDWLKRGANQLSRTRRGSKPIDFGLTKPWASLIHKAQQGPSSPTWASSGIPPEAQVLDAAPAKFPGAGIAAPASAKLLKQSASPRRSANAQLDVDQGRRGPGRLPGLSTTIRSGLAATGKALGKHLTKGITQEADWRAQILSEGQAVGRWPQKPR